VEQNGEVDGMKACINMRDFMEQNKDAALFQMNFPWKSGNMESVGKKSDTKI
jgi:hypothetical protein